MVLVAAVDGLHYLFMIPLCLLSILLILVILVQRGRGGGLTGALGGMGGQSAFGTKAGDLFTRITIGVAALWVVLSMLSLRVLNHRSATAGLSTNRPPATATMPAPSKSTTGTPAKQPASGEKPAEGKSTPETPAPAGAPTGAKAPPPAGGAPAESQTKPDESAKP